MCRLLQVLYCLRLFINDCDSLKKIKKIIFGFLDFIAYSNLFLSLAVFCSTFQAGFIFNYSKTSSFLFGIVNFLAAFVLYNAQRIYQSLNPEAENRLLWYQKNKKYIFTLFFVFAFVFSRLIYAVFSMYYQAFFIYLVLTPLSLIYFLPPFELRKKSFLKSFHIAFIWVIVCVIVPLLFEEDGYKGLADFKKDELLYALSQFCFIAAICIPFDIRDYEKDKHQHVNSLPVLTGIKKSKYTAFLLLIVYLSLSFFIETKNLILIRGGVFTASIIVVAFSEPKRHRYYFMYLTDGLIILQSLLLFILLK